jgi:chemotaxis protein CheX
MSEMEPAAAGPLTLPAILDLTAATALRRDLLERRGADLELAAGDVERIGGLCLQVLLAAQATWAADGHTFKIAGPSEALSEALAAMGAEALHTTEINA